MQAACRHKNATLEMHACTLQITPQEPSGDSRPSERHREQAVLDRLASRRRQLCQKACSAQQCQCMNMLASNVSCIAPPLTHCQWCRVCHELPLKLSIRAGQPRKLTGLTPKSRHGQRPRQGSPCVVLFELVLCITAPGVGPDKIPR